ncbi:hypothetical protein ACFE04_021736 [Oxalis oulophora]
MAGSSHQHNEINIIDDAINELLFDEDDEQSLQIMKEWQAFGKLAFFTLRYHSGTIQLYYEKETLNDQFHHLKAHVDIGDILGVTGELSVRVNSFAILTKSLLPLPNKYHGLTNVDKRYRQRHTNNSKASSYLGGI